MLVLMFASLVHISKEPLEVGQFFLLFLENDYLACYQRDWHYLYPPGCNRFQDEIGLRHNGPLAQYSQLRHA